MKIKNTIISIFIFCLMFTTLFPYKNILAASSTATVKIEVLNVRAGPSTSENIIDQITKGETFPVSSKKGDWLEIVLKDQRKGWVASWLVDYEEKDSVLTTGVQNKQITPTVSSLRVRSGPGTNFDILGLISNGDYFDVISGEKNWTKILFNGQQGWVHSTFITSADASQINETLEAKDIEITASILNVRNKPFLSSTIVGKLKQGSIVTYSKKEDGWYYINDELVQGWVSGDYVKEASTSSPKSEPEKETTEQKKEMTVTASILNVRKSPSLGTEIIARLEQGTSVFVINETEEWSKIQYEGIEGWVSSEFLVKAQNNKEQSKLTKSLTILYNGTNIRRGPSTNTDVIKRGNQGDTFKVLHKEGDWYEIALDDNSSAYVAGWIVKVSDDVPKVEKNTHEQSLKGKTIVIDAGHGGRDNGTTGISGTLEKKLTWKTAKLLADKLTDSGADVELTRDGDYYITLQYRVSLSHYYNADAFISLHYDSIPDPSVRGVGTFYYDDTDKKLAEEIQERLVDETGLKDRNARFGNYHVLRENKQPSVLLELGFLSNKKEEWHVNSNNYQENATTAILKGLVNYFSE